MNSVKHKTEFLLEADQLADFLRTVAADLEKGIVQIGTTQGQVEGMLKVSISLKAEGIGYRVKLKGRFPEGVDSSAAAKPGSYAALKARMKADFKAIRADLSSGALPAQAQVEAFVADCARMVSFPGKGDELYSGFSGAVVSLSRAAAANDIAAVRAAVEELAAFKHSCHAKLK